MARDLREAGYGRLAWLLAQRPQQGDGVLVAAVRYFFRRAIEEDPKLFQGLAFSQLERLGDAQEQGFTALAAAMTQQGERLEELLADVRVVVVETHSAVLDLQGQIEGQGGQIQEIGQAVQKLLEQHQLHDREVRPGDSLSIRNDNERQLVRQVVARYRALPDTERRQMPALLNGIGKLEVVAGDFDAAQKDFQAVALMEQDNKAQAEAHYNAYLASLEKRDWPAAFQEFFKAVKLDAKRLAPFPVGKYHPLRILGAGGFGVALLCRHKELKADVVVKTLIGDDLERSVDDVFKEAKVFFQLDHPAIIRLLDCGYTIAASKSRPYFVMDYFDGTNLEEHVQKNGPLSPEEMVMVARQVADGLRAAHGKSILHRDVKPANLLVRKDSSGWHVKLIDFGLALRRDASRETVSSWKTLRGSSIAGTLGYAAPEQMGKTEGAKVGPYSDVYGFGKTCYYALLGTPEPDDDEKEPASPLAKTSEQLHCAAIGKRIQVFADVLQRLDDLSAERDTENLSRPEPVALPLAVAVSAPLTPPPSAILVEMWYYSRDGEQFGPLAEEVMIQLIASGKIRPQDSIWKAGLADWVRADSITEFANDTAAALPPPVAHTQSSVPVVSGQPKSRKVGLREAVATILDRFVNEKSFYRLTNVPDRKLAGATQSCKLGKGEYILALIDCTLFGSASDCVLFTNKALRYYHSAGAEPNPGHFPYRSLISKRFSTYWINCVSLGGADYINLSHSAFPRNSLIDLLEAIRDLVADREGVG